jgi:hypothetical protein
LAVGFFFLGVSFEKSYGPEQQEVPEHASRRRKTMQGLEARNPASPPATLESERDLPIVERELLQEVLRALRVIRYGSVVITVHDGHIVEIQKTERIRKGSAKQV